MQNADGGLQREHPGVAGEAGRPGAETLEGAGPFTVFAPTNAAFDKLPKAGRSCPHDPRRSCQARRACSTYHVIAGRLLAADLKDGQELTTVNGEKLHVIGKGR
ncbi:MAG: fasciclin domain-containing protein [Hymenobacter sp.]